jgi:hypothetical protein
MPNPFWPPSDTRHYVPLGAGAESVNYEPGNEIKGATVADPEAAKALFKLLSDYPSKASGLGRVFKWLFTSPVTIYTSQTIIISRYTTI